MWFYEKLHSGVKLGIEGCPVCRKKTEYQDCRIYRTSALGRVLTLDGIVQTTEKDEFIYHEMLTHPLLFSHPRPRDILVIGAGDGGVLREVLKHRIKSLTWVEIDRTVTDFSKAHLPFLNKGVFTDKRVKLVIEDGVKFAENTDKKFDIVIIDSSDPVGPSKSLFSGRFYRSVYSILKTKGLMVRQTGALMFQEDVLAENYRNLKKVFPCVTVQLAAIPTYIGGFFSFLIAGKGIDFEGVPLRSVRARYNRLGFKTRYYNPDIHFASLKLPNYLKEVIA